MSSPTGVNLTVEVSVRQAKLSADKLAPSILIRFEG